MTVLLLAGSGEAKTIAQGLLDLNIPAVASLAGATRTPDQLALSTRSGGFGGSPGFKEYLRAQKITAVIDATHPFASRITARTADTCKELNIPYLYCCRPGWSAEPGDQWTEIAKEEEAVEHMALGATVFLGTGRQTLARFANLEGRHVICRQIDPPTQPFPFSGGEYLIGRPPFPVAEEKALFARLGVDWLIVKNAGGQPSRTKLAAANELGIPVLMIRRPALPDALVVETADAAIRWAQTL